MANNLTLAGAAFSTGASGFGQAMSAGTGATAGNVIPASGGFYVEGFIDLPSTSGTYVAVGSSDTFWIGTSGGSIVAHYGSGSGDVPLAGPAFPFGTRPHVRLVASEAGGAFFVNGVSVASSPSKLSASGAKFDTALGVHGFERTDSFFANYVWPGTVDEVAVFSGVPALDSSAPPSAPDSFKPPSAPYSNTTAGLVALYHLDGNGLDSAGAAAAPAPSPAPASIVTNLPDDPGILYSPYNWSVTHAAAASWNPGAYFKTMFSGASCTLNFDVSANAAPLPQVIYRVDNGGWTQAAVAATIPCTIPPATAGNADVGYHLLEVIYKSRDSSNGSVIWSNPSPTVPVFTGLTLAAGGVLVAPGRAPLNVAIFGDSITEGIRTLGEASSSTPDDNDARLCWAYEMGRLLGAEVGIVGHGGSGYNGAGVGGIPAFPTSLALVGPGIGRAFAPQPDLILVNHGTNDGGDVTANATASVNALLAACPSARIVLLNPFPRGDNAGLQAAAAGCAAPARVRWASTAGFFNTALGGDSISLHPSGPNGVLLIAPKVAAAVRPFLSSGVPNRWTHSSITSGSTIAPDGTLAGLPSTIVAGQPLSAATFTPPQTAIYFVLYRVAGAVEEGSRWSSNVLSGNLTLLIPQAASGYTVRGYTAQTGGTLAYESAQFTATAAPGALPATPTQALDSGTTSSGTTMNWSATAPSYRVLARPGAGTVYGSLADATVSTNSYTFTGLAPSSGARAVVIPQNANGYGTPSGQFLSFTTALAATGSYTGTLSVTQPTLTRIYQRDTRTGGAFGKGVGAVGLAVTLSTAAATLDYRLRDADAASNPVRQDWTALGGAEPAGTVTLSPSIPASPYRYLMDVRASGDTTHAVLGSQAFGVGEVVALAGQSLATNCLAVGYSPEGSIASVGITPAANGYEFAPLVALADGSNTAPVAPDPNLWITPADGSFYGSAFAAEFLRLVTGQAGVVAALVGYAAGGTSITQWQPGQALNATLKATLDRVGKFGSLIWIQGHSDSQSGMSAATYQGLLASLFADLTARYPDAYSRLICSIPAEASTYWGTPAQVNAIRAGALAYVASRASATYVAGLDMQVSGDGTHPNQAGRLTLARAFYRAFMASVGLAPAKPGPSITGATRAAGSNVIKLAVTQSAGGTALVGVGTPANQFTVYPANAMFGALAISNLAIVSPTEIDLTLAAAPADAQALDVWYRLADSDTGAITGSGIYDNATDGDGLATGRQLQLVAAAIPAAAPNPQAAPAPAPASGGTVLTFAGPAGTLPTGAATLTPVGSNPPTGMALDGNGALLLPSQNFAYAQLRGLGIQGDGTVEIDAAGGSQPLDLVVILHASADNSTNSAVVFQGEYQHVGVYVPGASGPTVLPAPGTFTKVKVTSAGAALTIVVDGATVGTVTAATTPASGYLGIGSSSQASPQVAISEVSFQ